jgi:uncharacterized protein (TIGR02145 family)
MKSIEDSSAYKFVKHLLLPILIIPLIFSCNKVEDTTTVPAVTTSPIKEITITGATGGGNVTSSGGVKITARGICFGTGANPGVEGSKTSDGTGAGEFTSSLNGLLPNTTYFVRAYATNALGTGYGAQLSFKTLQDGSIVLDYDGNIYHPVVIGTQTWLRENLKTTHTSKGSVIKRVDGETEWSSITVGAFSDFDKDSANSETYGHLYNWSAVADSGNVCPDGYRVPNDSEWQMLIDYLGGNDAAGGKLKSTGTLEGGNGLWKYPNTGATNLSGFSAHPGGNRLPSGTFELKSESAIFWSSTKGTDQAWSREINFKYADVSRDLSDVRHGYSVRCIKNE